MKPAYQSSTHNDNIYGFCNASKAVDGNLTPYLTKGHCSHINVTDPYRWLVVDLGTKYQLDYVIIYNRMDPPLVTLKRLDDIWIGLTNIDVNNAMPQRGQYPLCGQFNGTMAYSGKGVVKCNYNLPPGRFLIVQQDLNAGDGKGMSICEVEAYAYQKVLSSEELNWKFLPGVRLDKYRTYRSLSNWGILKCIVKCLNNVPRCDSINHNPSTKLCELSMHISGYNRSSLILSAGWNIWFATFN